MRPLRQLPLASEGLRRGRGSGSGTGVDFHNSRVFDFQMTDRLYYTDPYLREFDARVVERTTRESKPAVVLDRTAFYPTSGGQPYDVGTLSGVAVVDVVEVGDGRLLHVVDRL